MGKISLLQSIAFINLHRTLEGILSWTRHPQPEPLTEGWLESVRQNIREDTGVAEQVARNAGLERIAETISRARTAALRFVVLIQSDPALSTVAARHWVMQDDRRAVEDLSELSAQIRVFGNGLFDEVESEDEGGALIEQHPDEEPFVESEWTIWMQKKVLRMHFKEHGKEYADSGWTALIQRLVKERVAMDNEPGKGKKTIRVRLSYFKAIGIPCP